MIAIEFKTPKLFALQYTKEHYDLFVALGKKLKENPVPVSIQALPGVKLEWNWYTERLIFEPGPEDFSVTVPLEGYFVFADPARPNLECKVYSKAEFEKTFQASAHKTEVASTKRIEELEKALLESYHFIDDSGVQAGASHALNGIERVLDIEQAQKKYQS